MVCTRGGGPASRRPDIIRMTGISKSIANSGTVKEALPVVLDDRHDPVHVVGVSLHGGPLVRRKT